MNAGVIALWKKRQTFFDRKQTPRRSDRSVIPLPSIACMSIKRWVNRRESSNGNIYEWPLLKNSLAKLQIILQPVAKANFRLYRNIAGGIELRAQNSYEFSLYSPSYSISKAFL
jgi:hypothetical protein